MPDPLCPLCGVLSESTGHILWDCASSTAVWMECNKTIQKLSIAEDDGLCLFEKLMEKLDDDDLILVSCLARRIWLWRNSVVFGGQPSSPVHLVQSTIDSLADFHQARQAPDIRVNPL